MRALIVLEQRFSEFNGHLYATSISSYSFWQRYLEIFDDVTIVARVKKVETLPENHICSTGPKVGFVPIQYFVGMSDFLKKALNVWRLSSVASDHPGAFILRVPGVIGTIIWLQLLYKKKPYALEVVGDPKEALTTKIWGNPLIFPIQQILHFALKMQCKNAIAGVSYVTNKLKIKYPAGKNVQNVDILPTGIDNEGCIPRILATLPGRDGSWSKTSRKKLIYVGTLEVLYKGQEVLIRSLYGCIAKGMDLELELVGDGRCRSNLEHLASRLGISDRVIFVGNVSDRNKLILRLMKADLFVLPSLSEGLPRAMIEAMACGLPCVGTSVGGIPEIIGNENTVAPGDSQALAEKICQVLNDPKRLKEMADKNQHKASTYTVNALRNKRMNFYSRIKSITDGRD